MLDRLQGCVNWLRGETTTGGAESAPLTGPEMTYFSQRDQEEVKQDRAMSWRKFCCCMCCLGPPAIITVIVLAVKYSGSETPPSPPLPPHCEPGFFLNLTAPEQTGNALASGDNMLAPLFQHFLQECFGLLSATGLVLNWNATPVMPFSGATGGFLRPDCTVDEAGTDVLINFTPKWDKSNLVLQSYLRRRAALRQENASTKALKSTTRTQLIDAYLAEGESRPRAEWLARRALKMTTTHSEEALKMTLGDQTATDTHAGALFAPTLQEALALLRNSTVSATCTTPPCAPRSGEYTIGMTYHAAVNGTTPHVVTISQTEGVSVA